MKSKNKTSALAILTSLRGEQTNNNSTSFQDLYQLDDLVENVNITPTLSDDNLTSSLSSNEANSQVKEDPLVVKIRDTLTGEVTVQKMQPDRVWNLEKNKNIMVELNGDGQGSDNGSNLWDFLENFLKSQYFVPYQLRDRIRCQRPKNNYNGSLLRINYQSIYLKIRNLLPVQVFL